MTVADVRRDLVEALVRRLGAGAVSTDTAARSVASRDYAWLSPILTEDLPDSIADVVVWPTSPSEVEFVLAEAHRHGVPVTPRGRGTGNYGQAVPLARGLVADLTRCDRITSITDGIADVEAGVTFARLEAAANDVGWEVAVMPSMVGSTVGGFLAGGNQGIGSIEHGSIWDGWIMGLDIVECHAAPNGRRVGPADVAS
ncbi:MAG: FAD-binding oxidoreductase [Ilumatobacteraceae bacterium]